MPLAEERPPRSSPGPPRAARAAARGSTPPAGCGRGARPARAWPCPKSSIRQAQAWATSIGVRSSRTRFSTSASSSRSRSSTCRTTAGTRSRPASRAARQRRSPATSAWRPVARPPGPPAIGCSTPLARIEAASAREGAVVDARPAAGSGWARCASTGSSRSAGAAAVAARAVLAQQRREAAPEAAAAARALSHGRRPPWPPRSRRRRPRSGGRSGSPARRTTAPRPGARCAG